MYGIYICTKIYNSVACNVMSHSGNEGKIEFISLLLEKYCKT